MRKCKKKDAKPLFNRVLKKRDKNLWETPEEFTEFLILDIQTRLDVNQLGFAQMHPTTYLNGERWDDEIVTAEQDSLMGRLTDRSWADHMVQSDEKLIN